MHCFYSKKKNLFATLIWKLALSKLLSSFLYIDIILPLHFNFFLRCTLADHFNLIRCVVSSEYISSVSPTSLFHIFLSFEKPRLVYLLWKELQMGRGRKKIISPQVHSSNGCNSQLWTKIEPEPGVSSRSPKWKARAQTPGPSLAGSRIWNGAARAQTSPIMGYWCHRQQLYS